MKILPAAIQTLCCLLAAGVLGADDRNCGAGSVRLLRVTEPSFDRYTSRPTLVRQQWFRDNFWRLIVFTPYFDNKLSWYSNASVYKDLYAIYRTGQVPGAHPEWILRDALGNPLYIPWDCSNGTCPQYAADMSDPMFRRQWIEEAVSLVAKGYPSLFIDDVNMEFRVGDGDGHFVTPMDRNTGAAMTYLDWRRYVAEFVEEIRAALPAIEIIHNSIWFAGPPVVRDQDAHIRRQIAAADLHLIEYGVNDQGLTGGTGQWSLNELLGYIDRVHNQGRGVILGSVPADAERAEYSLASYFLISTAADALASGEVTPDNWWNGYGVSLGQPLGSRTSWNRLLRRDFTGGIALVNPPGNSTVTAALPRQYSRVDGSIASSITLPPGRGAVLLSSTNLLRTGGCASDGLDGPILRPLEPGGRR